MPTHMSESEQKTQNIPKRILFIRPSALGDVCRSVPVVASLKQQWPMVDIDWLIQDTFAEAIVAHPATSDVVLFPRNQLRQWYFPGGLVRTIRFLRTLKSKQYDLVIDGQGLGRSGLFSWATKSPIRIGFASAREGGKLGYTKRVQAKSVHTVDQMLELVEAAGATPVKDMRLYATQQNSQWWSKRREEKAIHRYAVIAPTSRWKSKQWPTDRFAEVASFLVDKGLKPVVVGAPHEFSQVEQLLHNKDVMVLLDEMTIGRLLAVIERANIVIANDSASLHIAVGFQRPCVGLYGPTNPAKVGPYNQPNSVVAADVDYSEVNYRDEKMNDGLMRSIEVDEVLSKIEEQLSVADS